MKGIIFDLDGVLVHTDEYHCQAWKALADRLGIYFDPVINHRLRGVSRMDSLDIVLEQWKGRPFSQEEKEKLAREKNAAYRRLLQQMTPESVTPEVRDTLAELRRRGYDLAVGSSSKNTKSILAYTQLSGLFQAVSDGTNITRSKPDPEVFLKAAEWLGLLPRECAVVEDAPSGIQAAKAAGMLAIGLGEAAGYGQTDRPISQFQDLLTLFP